MGESPQATVPPFRLSPGHELNISVKWKRIWRIRKIIKSHTHPSILTFLDSFPYSYVMALTPYPKSNNKYEHPSIVFSNDLKSWTEDGASNPIVYHSSYYNADPHISYDPIGKRIILYYERLLGGSDTTRHNALYAKYSYDCIKWSREFQVLPATHPGGLYVSPAVAPTTDRRYFLTWTVYVNLKTSEKRVLMYKSIDGLNLEFVGECNISQTYGGQNWNVWHLSIRNIGSKYWMFAAMNPAGKYDGESPIHLFLFESYDGLNWKGYSEPILTSEKVCAERLYRADFFVHDGVLHTVYSWMTSDYNWHISHTRESIGDSQLVSCNVIALNLKNA